MSERLKRAVMEVSDAICDGLILTAHNALAHTTTTVGPYRQAVTPEHIWDIKNYAITEKGDIEPIGNAINAAYAFIGRVGTTRATEAARKAVKAAA